MYVKYIDVELTNQTCKQSDNRSPILRQSAEGTYIASNQWAKWKSL